MGTRRGIKRSWREEEVGKRKRKDENGTGGLKKREESLEVWVVQSGE